jgi:hypothetical protein
VILRLVSRFDPSRTVTAPFLLMLAIVAYGCGASPQPTTTASVPGEGKSAAELLKPEQLWKYEGEGTDQRKVRISRQERVKLLRDAKNKAD